jgi:hypothetical protein
VVAAVGRPGRLEQRGGRMEHLGKRVRVGDVEIRDGERRYGRSHAGKVGQITRYSTGPGGAVASYEVRLDDGTLLELRPREVRFL